MAFRCYSSKKPSRSASVIHERASPAGGPLKTTQQQLEAHLARGLARIYLVAGEEPLLVAEALEQIRATARERGFDERELHVVERGFRWPRLEAGADNLSLFASRRIVELRLQSARPGDAGAKVIRALADDPDPDPDRLILIGVYDRLDAATARAAWVKSIEKHGVFVNVRPVSREALPGFIRGRAARYRLDLTADAATLLAEQVEGNLLAADQELAKMALTRPSGPVDAAAVRDAVANSSRFDVFRLTDAVLRGETRRALRILSVLRAEGVQPTLVAWAVNREISLLLKLRFGIEQGEGEGSVMRRLGVWQSRQAQTSRALRRLSWRDLSGLLTQAVAVDATIKGARRGQPWDALTQLVVAMLEPSRALAPPAR
jgi:DNA polymerase-3 subunit delta